MKALLLLVQIAEKKGEKKRLKALYEKVCALAPDNEIVLYNLAVLEYEAENREKSLSYFEAYLKKHPKDVETLRFLFDLYKKEKRKIPLLPQPELFLSECQGPGPLPLYF
jgi:tetratricopeptide (TPR) repeat protein